MDLSTSIAIGTGISLLKLVGARLIVLGAIIGVACGGYFINKYCQELIEKIEDFCLKNAENIGNSYKQAKEYLSQQSKGK